MHLGGFTSFLLILISVTEQISSDNTDYGACHIWGDPHLVMFPMSPTQANLRMSYYCKTPGRMLILKNQYIEITVNVTGAPFWNEDFEVTLFADYHPFCTITHTQRTCNSYHVDVAQTGSGLEILYFDADYLSVTINSHMVRNRRIFDIMVTQSYRIIMESSGLCVAKSPYCRLEKSNNPLRRRRRQTAESADATQVCDEYMKEAYRTAKDTVGSAGSSMSEYARAACITDVTMTGDPEWGRSAINFVAMDAVQQAPLTPTERHQKFQTVGRAIENAVSRIKENTNCTRYN